MNTEQTRENIFIYTEAKLYKSLHKNHDTFLPFLVGLTKRNVQVA